MLKSIYFVIFLLGTVCGKRNPISFYDLKSKKVLNPPITTSLASSENDSFNMSSVINIRLPFIGQPCACESLNCGCCAGMMIKQLNFDQKMCMNFTYDPMAFAINMDINMNENSVYTNMVSGRDPPPLCIPVPLPAPLPIPIEMCVKVFNIFTPGSNLHMCMNLMARVQMSPILILHFDCMRFGQDEFAFLKPDDNGGLMGVEMPLEMPAEVVNGTMVVYDPVYENKNATQG